MALVNVTTRDIFESEKILDALEESIKCCTDNLTEIKLNYIINKAPILLMNEELYKIDEKIFLLIEALSKPSYYENRKIGKIEESNLKELLRKLRLLILPLQMEKKKASAPKKYSSTYEVKYAKGLPNNVLDESCKINKMEINEKSNRFPNDISLIR